MQIQANNQRSLDEIAPLMKAYQNAGEHVIAAQRQSAAVIGRELERRQLDSFLPPLL